MLTVAPSGLLVGQLLWRNPMVLIIVPTIPIASTTAGRDMMKFVNDICFGEKQ
jgi:hypothetical protein